MSLPCASQPKRDFVLFGKLPSTLEHLLGNRILSSVEMVSNQDSPISTKDLKECRSALVMVPFAQTANDTMRYYRNLAESVFTALKSGPLKRVIHLSRFGAHRPDKTGPVSGCYEMERQLNWLRESSLLHFRCGFFPEELFDHLFLVPDKGSIQSLFSPSTPLPVSDPAMICRHIISAQDLPVKPGQFVKQPVPAVFFTIEKMLHYLFESRGVQAEYRQLRPKEAMEFYRQRGYGNGAAQCWGELIEHLNRDHGLLCDPTTESGSTFSFADLFGQLLAQAWVEPQE